MQREGLVVEVDRDLGRRGASAGRGDRLPVVLRQLDRKQAVVEGVAFEDVGESLALARGDDGAEAGLHDGPDGVLAARAAAEVAARPPGWSHPAAGVVQREIGLLRAVRFGVVDSGAPPGA